MRLMLAFLLLALFSSVAPFAEAAPVDEYVEDSVQYTGGPYENETFKFRLLKPSKLEAGKKYPVILFLHGAGERGSDNQKNLIHFPEYMVRPEFREKYQCFIVVPQCRSGKRWVDNDWSVKTSEPMKPEPTHQMKMAIAALDKTLEEQPIDEKRVYLTGLSMGGFGTFDLACRHPERFAAVVPVCGGGDDKQGAVLAKLPLWAAHGSRDGIVVPARSQEMIKAIKAAGGEPKYTEWPNAGHNSWTPTYTDPNGPLPWMFEQKQE